MSEFPAIEVRNVTVIYNQGTPNEVVALKDVSLSISKGEMIVVTGGNGSGKSTLLKAIAGTAPVVSGDIFINGKNVTKLPPYKRARLIGSVHQDPMLGTCPNLTVFENFQIALEESWWSPLPSRFNLDGEQLSLFSKTGLELERKVATPLNMLSGGQQQIITLCLALSSVRPILFLDEFTASLDENTKRTALKLVEIEAKARTMTVLTIMHDFENTRFHCHHIVEMAGGSIVRVN